MSGRVNRSLQDEAGGRKQGNSGRLSSTGKGWRAQKYLVYLDHGEKLGEVEGG